MDTKLCVVCCGANERDAKLRFYFDSFNNFTELSIDEADKIFQTSWYRPERDTVIFAHGFTGVPTGPAVTAVIKAYLDQEESNVALLNWERLASGQTASLASSYVNWAAPNARQLGIHLVSTFITLADAGLNLNKTHLIGHSLGAHIWGITGYNLFLRGIELPWITGLDPAFAGFERRHVSQKLNPRSAAFVDVIHTDPNKYGMRAPCGTVDFWPNYRMVGPVKQPGCPSNPVPVFSSDDLCSHNRSWQLLVDSVKYPGTLIGSYARNYKTWKNYSVADRNAVTLQLGKCDTKSRRGNYYLVTKAESMYGLGIDGL
ncbi:lipase member I-like [Melitaea cinxia]|uniref:lipase member I-like n=1 Tax=Melitaea cinxia TaxID=113334 RepID=UPI001E274955|nr:lipase member I-like [Melitaea cinxia]